MPHPGLLADLIVAVHVAYVAFVVVGLLSILIGWWRGWSWVRRPVWRYLHLVAILIVAGEAIFGVPCPLTVWESSLREQANQRVSEASFMGRLMHGLIFYELPTAVFTVAYVCIAVLIAATLWLVPPKQVRR